MNTQGILKSLVLLLEGSLFLTLSVMVFWFWTKFQRANLRELLTEKDNPAVGITLSGFLFGCVLAYTGSISSSGASLVAHLNDLAKFSLLILALQVLAVTVAGKFIFSDFSLRDEILERRNVAVAVGQAAVSIATGSIMVGAFSVPANGVLLSILWFLVGQILLLLVTGIYQRYITPYNDMAEIKSGNLAAAFALSGVIVAVGYTISHAIEGEFISWRNDLPGVLLYILFSLTMLVLMRLFTDKVILPKVSINDEITKDKNIGAGLIEGTVYILSAMLIAFFLT
ncbi:MAG: DUF350 domain-containing protein [bacterium]|nr:DUF350 domain-containing protein [bacterium]